VVFVAVLYFALPQIGVSQFLSERIQNLSTLQGSSVYGHYMSIIQAEEAIKRFDLPEYLVGRLQSRTETILPETYYVRTFYVRGGVSLLILLSIITLTLFEGHRRYRAAKGNPMRRGLFLAAFLGVGGIAFACLAIPYLDTFPSNFYFWFLVAIIWCEPMSETEVAAKLAARPRQHIAGRQAQVLASRLGGWRGKAGS
jgi:hypothetical protein